MKALPILFSAFVLAVAASAVTHIIMQPAAPASALATVGGGELDALRARVGELARALEATQADLRALTAETRALPALAGRAPDVDLEALVRDYMRAHHSELGEAASERAHAGAPPAVESVPELMAALAAAARDDGARQAIWKRAREAGQLDELVAAYEKLAEERSHDPDAQLAAGGAYLQKVFDVGEGPEAGIWASRADQAFDRALELDPRHWEARFTKAVALSFWPPLFGKQATAIRNFELLIEQQQGQPLQPHYAQTYELLGNLYQQAGKSEQALASWRAGAQLFPGNESLQTKAAGE